MTHNERVLALLKDGRPHSHHELYALHVVAHSRVSDLRKQGHDIEQWREGDLYLYRLLDRGGYVRMGTTAPAPIEQPVPCVSPPPAAHNVPVSERMSVPTAGLVPGGAAVLAGTCGTETGQLSMEVAA